MIIEQIYTGCLAQGAYYIQSGNEAVIIDPLREVNSYIEKAAANQAIIKYVFETHFHADFVSGHVDLSKQTGAPIVYGPNANPTFKAVIAIDNQIFKIGDITMKVLHTPGHTLESTSYLLIDEEGKESALFSGDTLFIGDVGRPDLAQKADHMTQEELAGMLYDSLREKIMPLNDDIVVYPAHGAGSACGKNMSKETTDTLGHQKKTNYALRSDMSKTEFIEEVTDGLLPPPAYFPLNVKLNREGYDSFESVLEKGTQALDPEAFEALANEVGAILLDTRDAQQQILVIADKGREEEVVTRLARVGYDHAIGYLDGGMKSWLESGREVDHIESITAEELAMRIEKDGALNILDVRQSSEYDAEHLLVAKNAALNYINEEMAKLDKNETYYVHCAGGYRSMIFNSILRARGFDHLIDIKGGFKAIQESGRFEISPYVCPTTLKNK